MAKAAREEEQLNNWNLDMCRMLYVNPAYAEEMAEQATTETQMEWFEWFFGCSLDLTSFRAAVSASRDSPQYMSEVLLPFDTLLKVSPEYDSFMVLWTLPAGARGVLRPAKDMDEVINHVLEQNREIVFAGLMGDSLCISAYSSVPYGSRNFYIRLIAQEDTRKVDDTLAKNEGAGWLTKKDSNKLWRIWEKKSAGFALYKEAEDWLITARDTSGPCLKRE